MHCARDAPPSPLPGYLASRLTCTARYHSYLHTDTAAQLHIAYLITDSPCRKHYLDTLSRTVWRRGCRCTTRTSQIICTCTCGRCRAAQYGPIHTTQAKESRLTYHGTAEMAVRAGLRVEIDRWESKSKSTREPERGLFLPVDKNQSKTTFRRYLQLFFSAPGSCRAGC